VIYQLERGSGQIQNVFSKLNPATQFLFVVGYGITQPVLPPAFLEPTTLTWHIIAILRAIGWYLMLPLLVYAPFAVRRAAPGGERRVWYWILAFCWLWIVVCAIRAGGDQWDNPRYRVIFLGWEAILAAWAFEWALAHRDRWLWRWLLVEAVFVLAFTEWYITRHIFKIAHLGIWPMIAVVLGLSALILIGGWLWDRRKKLRVGIRE
jgi:uncharacterized membrane protein